MSSSEHSSGFVQHILAGPDDAELSPRDLALLEAHLRQPVSFAKVQRETRTLGYSPTLAARDKLRLILDFNRGLQRSRAPGEATPPPIQPAPPPPPPVPDNALLALLRVFTNGIADERLRQAAQILSDSGLGANEKLSRIDNLLPIPPTASSEQLGTLLGVSRQAVVKTAWWRKNRRGTTDEEIERRQARLIARGRTYERPRSEEEDDER